MKKKPHKLGKKPKSFSEKIQENLTAGFPILFPNPNKELPEEHRKKWELIMATGTDLPMINYTI